MLVHPEGASTWMWVLPLVFPVLLRPEELRGKWKPELSLWWDERVDGLSVWSKWEHSSCLLHTGLTVGYHFRAEAPSRSTVIERCFLRTSMIDFPNGHHNLFATASVGSPGSEVRDRRGHFFSVSCSAPKPCSFWENSPAQAQVQAGDPCPIPSQFRETGWASTTNWSVDFTVDAVSDDEKIRAGWSYCAVFTLPHK